MHEKTKLMTTSLNVVFAVRWMGRAWPVEVGHDDGDGEGDTEHAADGAEWGHQFASWSLWRNIAITYKKDEVRSLYALSAK